MRLCGTDPFLALNAVSIGGNEFINNAGSELGANPNSPAAKFTSTATQGELDLFSAAIGDGEVSAAAEVKEVAPAIGSLRALPGLATGGESLRTITGTWLRGTEGNAGFFPKQIADQLRGRQFSSFDEFRSAFWQQVANDPDLANQFSPANRALMAQGKAPYALKSQRAGDGFPQQVYNLHHITPIESGGGLYDMGNIMIVSPQYHMGLHGF